MRLTSEELHALDPGYWHAGVADRVMRLARAIEREVAERCAKACDERAAEWMDSSTADAPSRALEARQCERAIRAAYKENGNAE